jgi:thiol-disulfide isomerase/thioredoxin
MRRVAVLLAAGLLLVAASCTGDDDEPAAPDDPAAIDGVSLEGDDIGDFTLAGLGPDAATIALPDLRGRPVVVNFFASTCAPCVREMPALEAVHQELAGDVAFVGVAVADRADDALELVERTGVTYDLAADPTGEVFAAAGSSLLPSTIVLDADGEVVRRLTGEIDEDDLLDALAEVGG